MTDATELDEAAIRARLEAATPGPWRSAEQSDRNWWGIQSEHFALASVFDHPNAEFIAHARTDVGLLLTALDEARAEVQRERSALGQWRRLAHERLARATAELARAEAAEGALTAVRSDETEARVAEAIRRADGHMTEGEARSCARAAINAALATPTTTEGGEDRV